MFAFEIVIFRIPAGTPDGRTVFDVMFSDEYPPMENVLFPVMELLEPTY